MGGSKEGPRTKWFRDRTMLTLTLLFVVSALTFVPMSIWVLLFHRPLDPIKTAFFILYGFSMPFALAVMMYIFGIPRRRTTHRGHEGNPCDLCRGFVEALTSKGMAHTVRIIGPTYRWPFSPHVLITLQGGQSVRFIPEVRSKPPGFIATTSTSIEVLLRRDDDAKVALDIQDVIDDVQVVEDPALSALFQSHGEMLMKEARRLSLLMVAVSILIAAILILPIVMYHIYSFPLTLIWLVSSMLLTGILFMRAMGRFNDFAMGIMTDRLGRYLDALP